MSLLSLGMLFIITYQYHSLMKAIEQLVKSFESSVLFRYLSTNSTLINTCKQSVHFHTLNFLSQKYSLFLLHFQQTIYPLTLKGLGVEINLTHIYSTLAFKDRKSHKENIYKLISYS